jgi:signal transduction histidine kinase
LNRLRTILAITAVRLSLAYTLIFGLVAIVIVLYMTASTAGILRRQIRDAINAEFAELAEIYREDGVSAFYREVERNAAAPGSNLYVVADKAGQILAANVVSIESGVIQTQGWTRHPFTYVRQTGDRGKHEAVARIGELPNGMRLLIGRDLGEPERFRATVGRALMLSLAALLALGLATWVLVGRRALVRLDSVSRSAERILGGDRQARLPVSGGRDEFDRISEQLNSMLERIERLDTGLKQVADNIAHDLKTPLTRLRNKAERALTDGNGAPRDTLREIVADTDRIIAAFNALLTISRVDSGASAAEMAQLDISALVAGIGELYDPAVEEKGGRLEAHVEPGLTARGNRELLGQAVSNLIDNALKYGFAPDAAPELTLSARRSGASIEIAVGDRGPGIAPSDRERAMERLVRLDKSRSEPGNGLGLALVRAVAELHGGRLSLGDNRPGLLAAITLPAAAAG